MIKFISSYGIESFKQFFVSLSNCQVKPKYSSLAEFDPIWLIMIDVTCYVLRTVFREKNKKKMKGQSLFALPKLNKGKLHVLF